jgi:hypothetical protein
MGIMWFQPDLPSSRRPNLKRSRWLSLHSLRFCLPGGNTADELLSRLTEVGAFAAFDFRSRLRRIN